MSSIDFINIKSFLYGNYILLGNDFLINVFHFYMPENSFTFPYCFIMVYFLHNRFTVINALALYYPLFFPCSQLECDMFHQGRSFCLLFIALFRAWILVSGKQKELDKHLTIGELLLLIPLLQSTCNSFVNNLFSPKYFFQDFLILCVFFSVFYNVCWYAFKFKFIL